MLRGTGDGVCVLCAVCVDDLVVGVWVENMCGF